MKKQLLFAFELVFSLAIIGLVLWFANVREVIAIISGISLPLFGLSLVLYALIIIFMAYRIFVLLKAQKENVPYLQALKSNLAGMLVSDFTPARAGYFATAFSLAETGKVSLSKAIVSILAPQLFDFLVKITAGSLALLYILLVVTKSTDSLVGAFLGILVIACFMVIGYLALFSKKFLSLLQLGKGLPLASVFLEKICLMQKHAVALKSYIPFMIGIMLFTWFLKGLEWYALAAALSMSVSTDIPLPIFFMFLHSTVSILQFVPAPTLAGLGLSEAGAVALLALFHVSVPEATAFALMGRFVMIAVDSLGSFEASHVIRKNIDKIF